ncbi:MAG: hypothetical protein IT440_02810 [Phycisphaeraceae bacterium]|nr:hypothetical protein [Phycisphaeraceae bacterium]
MEGKGFGQFGFPRRPQVVEQLGPGLHASPPDDPLKLGSQVDASVPAAGNTGADDRSPLDLAQRQIRPTGAQHLVFQQKDRPANALRVAGLHAATFPGHHQAMRFRCRHLGLLDDNRIRAIAGNARSPEKVG